MIRTATIALLLSVVVPASFAVEAVPMLASEKSCRAAMESDKNSRTSDDGVTPKDRCIGQERSARAELIEQWTQFDRRDQKLCAGQTRLDGSPSYIDLLACVQTGPEAHTLEELDRR